MTITATTTRSPKGRVSGVTGIDLGYLNGKHLRKTLVDLGIPFNKGDTDEQISVMAVTYFFKHNSAEELSKCTLCQGMSPVKLSPCPYCGTVDAPTAKQPADKEAPKMSTTTENKDKKTTSTAIAKANGIPADVTIYTEKDLDKAVAEVQRLKGEGAAVLWQLGQQIDEIYKKQLWKQRLENGKQRWRSWDSFCNGELKMTPQNALQLSDIANACTIDDVRRFGKTKLGLLLQAPKEAQEKIKKSHLERGASTREVKKAVQEEKAKTGHRREPRQGPTKKGKSAATAKALAKSTTARKAKKKEITVAKILGRVAIKLYEKPTTKNYEIKDLKRAKTLADQPFGEHQLTNGVIQQFYVQKSAAGELGLVVVTKRADE